MPEEFEWADLSAGRKRPIIDKPLEIISKYRGTVYTNFCTLGRDLQTGMVYFMGLFWVFSTFFHLF